MSTKMESPAQGPSADEAGGALAALAEPASILCALALVLSMSVLVWFEPRMTGDTFMTLAGGRDVFDGKLGENDDWAFTTTDRIWMNQNWGTGVLFYSAHGVLGMNGVMAVKGAMMAAMALFLVVAGCQLGARPAPAMLVAAWTMFAARYYIDMRANMVGLCFVPMMMAALYWTRGHERRIWLAVAILTVWSQLHGSYVFGLLMMGLWTVCTYGLFAVRQAPSQEIRGAWHLLVAPIVALVMAVAASPYGMRNILQPFSGMGGDEGKVWRSIFEWQPIFTNQPVMIGSPREFLLQVGFVAALGVAWLLFCRHEGREPLDGMDRRRELGLLFNVLLFSVAIVMAINARRLIPISLVVGTPLVCLGMSWLLSQRKLAALTVVLVPLLYASSYGFDSMFTTLAARGWNLDWTSSPMPGVQDWLVKSRIAWPLATLLIVSTPVVVWQIARRGAPPVERPGRGRKGPSRKRKGRGEVPSPAATPVLAWPVVALAIVLAASTWWRVSHLVWWYSPNNPGFRTEPLFARMINHTAFPVGAVDFINENGIEGRVFSDWRWEGYLHWYCPQLELFIGGRSRQVYDTETYKNFQRVTGSATLDLVPELGMHLVIVGPRFMNQLMRSVMQDGSQWAPIYYDGRTWVVAHRGTEQTNRLIELAAAGQLKYPSEATAAVSRAACIFSPTVKGRQAELTTAAREANEAHAVPEVYMLIGRAAGKGLINGESTLQYLELEARRLAEMDHHVAMGYDIVRSRHMIASVLMQMYASGKIEAGAAFWRNQEQQLRQLVTAVQRGNEEPRIDPLPTVEMTPPPTSGAGRVSPSAAEALAGH